MIPNLSNPKSIQKAILSRQVSFTELCKIGSEVPSEVKEITSKNLFKEKLVEHFKKETFRCLVPCSDTMNDSQSAT